jgi:hypothetical protein
MQVGEGGSSARSYLGQPHRALYLLDSLPRGSCVTPEARPRAGAARRSG